jgi:hypothetical protein
VIHQTNTSLLGETIEVSTKQKTEDSQYEYPPPRQQTGIAKGINGAITLQGQLYVKPA